MRKLLLIMSLVFWMATPVSAEDGIPEGAQEFADTFFGQIVKDELKSSIAGDFNLNPNSENIIFGPLHPVYTFTKDFVKGKKIGADGIIKTEEYIAVVYQDGIPVNVIGTYEKASGEFEMSTFGYGVDIAQELHKLNAGEWVFSEAPKDGWYVYDGKTVKPLTQQTKKLMAEEKSVKEYQEIVIERYKNVDSRPGMAGGSGGGNIDIEFGMYMALGIACIAAVIVFFANNRKRKSKQG
ncbi:hypothetical protein V7201_18180 [Bacillus sp. JJ1122]|uniref:hypothetical protein n=1 Tax=Bacillus sp. JJ1122 TaxID=3122951 RepID=UPI002FFD6F09